ncbi:hypothetical protein [Nocardia sp. JCM 34519]|uniref:hypothetical protein n=1 Tax=Nocardia sp. JCM 34519 TaxID=2876118 RepID=UPI001CE4325F|nr:hypothetical protein [Nocardia sp. JCM 34519]
MALWAKPSADPRMAGANAEVRLVGVLGEAIVRPRVAGPDAELRVVSVVGDAVIRPRMAGADAEAWWALSVKPSSDRAWPDRMPSYAW